MTALDNRGTRNLRPERVDGWRRGVQVLAICVRVWAKPMYCLDDVPELAARMARSCPGCRGDGVRWETLARSNLDTGVAEARRPIAGELLLRSRMQKDIGRWISDAIE
jgi:hypothetical protein